MSLKWKIFKLANIVEIILTTGIAVGTIYATKFSFSNYYEFLAIVLIIFLSASVVANGFNNIFLLNNFKGGSKLNQRKKIWFWFLSVVLLLSVGLITLGLSFWYFYSKRQTIDQAASTGDTIGAIWGSAICLNGYLILYLQVVLFYKIRKHSNEVDSLLVNTIGLNDRQ